MYISFRTLIVLYHTAIFFRVHTNISFRQTNNLLVGDCPPEHEQSPITNSLLKKIQVSYIDHDSSTENHLLHLS